MGVITGKNYTCMDIRDLKGEAALDDGRSIIITESKVECPVDDVVSVKLEGILQKAERFPEGAGVWWVLTRPVRFVFAWNDFWMGIFWDRNKFRLYIFPIPMFGMRVDFKCVV